jgi:hypothetical protein
MEASESEPVLAKSNDLYLTDEEILERLNKLRKPVPKKKPGGTWNGRVAGVSIEEYRERKWGTDAAFNSTMRSGPSYSARGMLKYCVDPAMPSRHKPRNFQTGDLHKASHAVKYSPPSYTIGMAGLFDNRDKTQGPAEYKLKSTMSPSPHPTIPRNLGCRFGSATLLANDNISPPAPGEYNVSEALVHSAQIVKKPSWVIEGREAWFPKTEAPSAGPGEYKVEGLSKNGPERPVKWTMQNKTMPIEPPRGAERLFDKPPPWHYNPPGTLDCKNQHVHKNRPPIFSSSREPRGLLGS